MPRWNNRKKLPSQRKPRTHKPKSKKMCKGKARLIPKL